MRLLTVDWDYFFPNPAENDEGGVESLLYDWGHREAPLFMSSLLWSVRAEAFHRRGLPLPGTGDREVGWWGHFQFAPGAQLWVSESHALAGTPEIIRGIDEVWNFDAHHDLGYRGREDRQPGAAFDCGDWLQATVEDLGVTAHVRYPLWKTRAFEMDRPPEGYDVAFHYAEEEMPVFDRVHVCRSGVWVPTWLDTQFVRFVKAAGLPLRAPRGRDLADPLIVREDAVAVDRREDAQQLLHNLRSVS